MAYWGPWTEMPATHLSSLRKNQRTCFGEWVKGNLLLRKREQGGFDFTPLSPDFFGGKESTFFFFQKCSLKVVSVGKMMGAVGSGEAENWETCWVNGKGAAQTPGREKRNRIHAVPPPPRLSWEEGKWGTKDAHGPQLRSLDIQGHIETTPHPPPPSSHTRPRPSPELGEAGKEAASPLGCLSRSLGPVPNPSKE